MLRVNPKISEAFIDNNKEVSPILLQWFYNRGITDSSYISYFLGKSSPYVNPLLMKDVEKASLKIWDNIESHGHILVFGDKDADGITSTTLLLHALSALGANTGYYIPSRDEGYGITIESIDNYRNMIPDLSLIITVDNGIKSQDVAKWCNDEGIDFIVTDHHEVPNDNTFPKDAYAVINPKQDSCDYPEKNLAGVGVAYMLVKALIVVGQNNGIDVYGILNTPSVDMFLEDLLDLVAIGTIADMMPLMSLFNRNLVSRGLTVMRDYPRPGIAALVQKNRYIRSYGNISATDVGFTIAPVINSASRMAHPYKGLDLLRAIDIDEGLACADNLIEMNESRKSKQAELIDVIDDILAGKNIFPHTPIQSHPIIIEVVNASHGIIGLAAGDTMRVYKRPAIMFVRDGDIYHGSARSTDWFNITEALDECSHLLVKYGGHAGAAGMTLPVDNYDEFVALLTEKSLSKSANIQSVTTADLEIKISDINFELLQSIDNLQPIVGDDLVYTFYSRLLHVDMDTVKCFGKKNNHIRFDVYDDFNNRITCIGWKMADRFPLNDFPKYVDMVYHVENSTFGDNIQAILHDIEPSVIHGETLDRAKFLLGKRGDKHSRRI